MMRIMGDALVMRLPGKRLENGRNTGGTRRIIQ